LADAKLVFVLESEHGADSPVAYIQATEQFAVPCSNGVFGTAGTTVAALAVRKTEHFYSLSRFVPDVPSNQLLAHN
jgi:hypothetical protein